MAGELGVGGVVSESRTRRPVLGRMSVFVIGLVIGAMLGAAAVVMGGPLLDDLDPDAFASAPPAAATGPQAPAAIAGTAAGA